MLRRALDESYPAVVRRDLVTVTVTRLTANAAYRFAPPFLATISRGLDVSLSDLGVALAVTELGGLASPIIGRAIDRVPRRTSMVAGLVGIAAGALAAGGSQGVVSFAAGLLLLAVAKIVFDVALGSWIADEVPYDRRGRVVGLTETSWALGLLIGVSLLGIVTAVASWRWAYVAAAVAVLVTAGIIRGRLAGTPPGVVASRTAGPIGRLPAHGWLAVACVFGLMASSQALFVTFGAWLEDDFAISTAGLAAVVFGLGFVELASSSISAARTDVWGKGRSVVAGTIVMAPTALGLAAFDGSLPPAIVLLAVFIGAFEFCIVSAIPIGSELVPGRPARGIATMIACGTLGRAVMSIPATRLYEHHGLAAPALLAAGSAALAGTAMVLRQRSVVRGPAAVVDRARSDSP